METLANTSIQIYTHVRADESLTEVFGALKMKILLFSEFALKRLQLLSFFKIDVFITAEKKCTLLSGQESSL